MPTRRAKPATKPAAAPAAPAPRLPLGVYVNHNRSTAVVIKHVDKGVWFLSMKSGSITCDMASEERFAREYSRYLAAYPLKRAVRAYAKSFLQREERVDKILKTLLRNL